MTHHTRLITALLCMAFACGTATAHDGEHPPDMRLWRDVDGLFEMEASFVLAQGDRVQLRKHDGGLTWMPLDRLSLADRVWVRNRLAAIRAVNGVEPVVEPAVPTADTAGAVPVMAGVGVLVGLALVGLLFRRRPTTVVAAGVLWCSLTIIIAGCGTSQPPRGPRDPNPPPMQKHFEPYKATLTFDWDDRYFYVGSDGMPDHPMMVGITAWQQQVPIAQAYTGRNAWAIPLRPKTTEKPVSAKTALFRGAIALAVNGVPIFNPIKNDGKTDTYLAGELDEYGGHCGRADDYHYHIAPVHLEKVVGKGKPIGYALDGYPLYGYTDAEGKEPRDLDEFNGRTEADGYRYYSTKKYPYVNGGLRGVVTVKDDQIDPQPRAYSPRAALTPLRGAKITGFERDEARQTATVRYDLNGKTQAVRYTKNADESYTFRFIDAAGKETVETYKSRPDGKRPPPAKDRSADKGPPPKDSPKGKDTPRPPEPPRGKQVGTFQLTSPAFEAGKPIPAEFTGDGAGVSPPLRWGGAPEGTKFYALQLWHKPKADGDEVKSYWVVTNIPASVTGLEKNSRGVGVEGFNDKRRTGYDPMNSKGPGVKEYHVTLYALSAEPRFAEEKVNRAELLRAIKDITLAEATLTYTHERKSN